MVEEEILRYLKDEIFTAFGYPINFVIIDVKSNPKYPASTKGVTLRFPIGRIEISNELIENLTIDELKFVIAHEATHIIENHLIFNAEKIYYFIKTILDEISKNYPVALFFKLLLDVKEIRDVFRHNLLGELPLRAEITKEQEIQADIAAIKVTGNKEAAISCLKKLVGGDLNAPSHFWEGLDVKVPVMTMRERIEEINRRVSNT